MIDHRPYEDLGVMHRDWLTAKLHFAFANMGRPEHRPLGALRVWNDDEFAPRSGFPSHSHENVEIVTNVLEGAITHQDNLGNKARLEAGSVQVMSAGAEIHHSEFNAEPVPARLFQIWIEPRHRGGASRWSSRAFPRADRNGRLMALASGDPSELSALFINADARVLIASMQPGETIVHYLGKGRSAYLVTTVGSIELDGFPIAPRDGAAVTGEPRFSVTSLSETEIVVVEVG
ncbi:pirin family protein [Microvirga sesbaniae]|uniref:pirin family protein n=1 Tax=Microvirga sesbaniae TaxID=681392 RepID=UPI0021CA8A95|nr:pirin family protein [Microvirga sp. HBU67692]